MDNRKGVVTFFLFLSAIILLQVLSMLRTECFYEGLSLLIDKTLTNTAFISDAKVHSDAAPVSEEGYPGDEAFNIGDKNGNEKNKNGSDSVFDGFGRAGVDSNICHGWRFGAGREGAKG
jgi:hypothetical protein